MEEKETMKYNPTSLIILLLIVLFARPLAAQDTLFIASAANFIRPLEELAATYGDQQNVKLTLSYGSSGKLYAQLLHGAPYDMFLSADRKRPALLHQQGICEPPFRYAAGRVVLWSTDKTDKDTTWQEVLALNDGKIAIASPETAPYGEVPFRVLQEQGLLKDLQPRLVFGQSAGQTFLFAGSGAASFGFIALSQALSPQGLKGHYWLMPESDSVEQWGCVTVSGKKVTASRRLHAFLTGDTGQAIIRNHGYQ
jgi:molybdate transport system substrate-binding protein